MAIGLRLFRERFRDGQFLNGGVTILKIAPIGTDDLQCLWNLFTQLGQRSCLTQTAQHLRLCPLDEKRGIAATDFDAADFHGAMVEQTHELIRHRHERIDP